SLLVVGCIGMAALGVALDRGHAPLTAFLGLGLCLAIAAFFGYHMPARTRAGARALEHVLGFEEFLRRVERDRLERTVLSPAMFEAYLPHAMALGLEKRWARAFEDIYTAPPRWYQGNKLDGFRAIDFVDSLGRMSTRTAAAMTSAPRSAGRIGGGSGFSGGGGCSGGGVGGGSVGGFCRALRPQSLWSTLHRAGLDVPWHGCEEAHGVAHHGHTSGAGRPRCTADRARGGPGGD